LITFRKTFPHASMFLPRWFLKQATSQTVSFPDLPLPPSLLTTRDPRSRCLFRLPFSSVAPSCVCGQYSCEKVRRLLSLCVPFFFSSRSPICNHPFFCAVLSSDRSLFLFEVKSEVCFFIPFFQHSRKLTSFSDPLPYRLASPASISETCFLAFLLAFPSLIESAFWCFLSFMVDFLSPSDAFFDSRGRRDSRFPDKSFALVVMERLFF